MAEFVNKESFRNALINSPLCIPADKGNTDYLEGAQYRLNDTLALLDEFPGIPAGEYIRREDIRKEIDENRPGRHYEDAWALTIINSIPTAFEAEPRTGKWVYNTAKDAEEGRAVREGWVCSRCNAEPWHVGVSRDVLPFYCPYCGAKMEAPDA